MKHWNCQTFRTNQQIFKLLLNYQLRRPKRQVEIDKRKYCNVSNLQLDFFHLNL